MATAAAGAPIVLVGHHDTVFPPGHFEGWKEDGGRAIGPGALDMKGGLAIIRTALAALDEAGVLARAAAGRDVRRRRRSRLADVSKPHLDRAREGRGMRARVRVGTRAGHDHHASQAASAR